MMILGHAQIGKFYIHIANCEISPSPGEWYQKLERDLYLVFIAERGLADMYYCVSFKDPRFASFKPVPPSGEKPKDGPLEKEWIVANAEYQWLLDNNQPSSLWKLRRSKVEQLIKLCESLS